MHQSKPRVSIGFPVFNGEQYLAEALDSLLNQSYTDFELILCDNASTDSTPAICRRYAALDARVRYVRHPTNIGAMQNWYRSFALSSGEYFTGAAHDDRYHPEFLQKCVAVLDADPTVAVCYTKTQIIDQAGNSRGEFTVALDTTSPQAHVRLYNVIGIDYLCIQLYGVMRSSSFGRTRPYTGYYGSDRNALAELALLGKIYEIPEALFYHRLHPQALGAAKHSGRSLQELRALDPGVDWHSRFADMKRFGNYFIAVTNAPLPPAERLRCYLQLFRLLAGKSTNRLKRRRQLAATAH